MKERNSIAVLPFINRSNDIENEYFCDGITEEIINALTKIKQLKVIARTSSFAFKGKKIDIRKIGEQLGVNTILEGSIKKSQEIVRITAQLIDANDGSHYWSKKFDRELINIFDLEDEISIAIADEIRNNFGHFDVQDHLIKQPTNSIDAYQLFLKGRFNQLQWTPDALKKAINFYNEAISLDVNYAKAYYGNVQCYELLTTWGYMSKEEGTEKVFLNLMKAKEIDTHLPEYPMCYVNKCFWREWDFKPTYHYIKDVLAINPNHIDALDVMVKLFMAHGHFNEAIFYGKKLLEIDPLSANNQYIFANIYYYKGDFDITLHHITKAIHLRPDFDLAYHKKAVCLIALNKREQLENEFQFNPLWEKIQLLNEAVNENRNSLPKEVLSNFLSNHLKRDQLTLFELFILANTNYTNEAFELLKQFVSQKRGQILNYKQEPLLKPLREFNDFYNLHVSNFSIDEIVDNQKTIETTKPLLLEEEQKELQNKLAAYFNEEKPYLDASLSLSTISEKLEISTNKVSFLINEVIGMNFNNYVNSYRLNHFKTIALNPKNSHLTILGLAYDSGFNSKSVFNTYFKKVEGNTPSQWVKYNKN
jgi:TolB-like protein/AraC-like DNA-binding protein